MMASVSSCQLDDCGGETRVRWHWVRDDGGGFTVSHAGVGYLRALFLGQSPSSGKGTDLMGTFQLPMKDMGVTVDMIGARRVDTPENIGDVAPALLERG